MRREFYIRNFAGIRWKRIDPETGAVLDFKLESDQGHNPNTVNLVGIESPGITCALPLARRAVARLVEVEMPAPVHEGDVAIADVLGLGIDVIVTKDVEAA